MVTARQNELLTRVEGDAPMGRWMREKHWIPCALSASVEAGGAPQAVRLLGEDFVAFRASDGRVGFLDEACPHRRASLLLARNEDCGLRCIFHAWKIDVSGKVVEVPSEGERSAEFARHLKVNHYPTFEGGGLLWVYLGQGEPPPRPPLPFIDLPAENVFITRSVSPCNWFQGVEGTIDSVHVGTLHMSWIGGKDFRDADIGNTLSSHPRYETEETAYGIRAAALRSLDEDRQYVRTTEYVMPFVSLVPGADLDREGTMFISVPMDDTHHMLFWGLWYEDHPADARPDERTSSEVRDPNNYALLSGNKHDRWAQDRDAMDKGHFSGFAGNLLDEDMAVQASMGPITDRTREQLAASDYGIVQARNLLLSAVARFEAGHFETSGQGVVRPFDGVLTAQEDWRDHGGQEGGEPADEGSRPLAPAG